MERLRLTGKMNGHVHELSDIVSIHSGIKLELVRLTRYLLKFLKRRAYLVILRLYRMVQSDRINRIEVECEAMEQLLQYCFNHFGIVAHC